MIMPGTTFEFFVQWHLTEQCNLHCRHCYQHAEIPAMNFHEILKAINSVISTFNSWTSDYEMVLAPSFHFTGGEPILHKNLFKILDYVRSYGYATALMSNGTLINDDIARKLQQVQVEEVQVSIEGMETVHDGIRGEGSFRKAWQGIENLIDHGVDTSINLTLSRINIGQIQGLVSLAADTGVSSVTFSRLVACGRGNELGSQILSPQELAEFYKYIMENRSDWKVMIDSRDPLFTVAGLEGAIPDVEFPAGGCAAGVFGITIAADGTVMPCRRMDLSIGNIKKSSLRQIWAESPVLWSLRDRQNYHGRCHTCRYWTICRGCRAVALAKARDNGKEDYLGDDPQCPYYKESE